MNHGREAIGSGSGGGDPATPTGGPDFRSAYPDPRERAALLHELVFRRLPEGAPDPAQASACDARLALAALLGDVVRRRRKSEAAPTLPLPSDLAVDALQVVGIPAHLYQLPHPEFLPGAYQMLAMAKGDGRGPRCFFLERIESPWGRDIGRLTFLGPAAGERIDAGILVQPNREAFLGGVEVALRSWVDTSGR